MRNRRLAIIVLGATLPFLSCAEQNTPATPTPSPTPTPAPSASPTPTPPPAASPSPSPSNTPEGTHDPAVYATAGVHSYRRNGNLVRSGASFFLPGDAIYLNCTPRDAKGNKTDNHGPIKSWGIFSVELAVGTATSGDFHFTDMRSFNPDLHIHNPISRAGTIKAYCTVVGLSRSGNHNMPIKAKK